jgi:hypothetical protein
MSDKAVNWITSTCLIGLIPVFLRLCVWFISKSGIEAIAMSDVVAFGLVLHSSNINEVNSVGGDDTNWRTVHTSLSICFIAVYGLLLYITISPNANVDMVRALYFALLLSVVSFVISWTIFFRSAAAADVS